jgi:mono/diheme cytochrome c family protein
MAFLLLIFILALIVHYRPSRAPRRRAVLALGTAAIVASAWGASPRAGGAAPPAPARPAAEAGAGSALYRRYCQGCHGADGRGDRGGGVQGLPDFSRSAWQQQRTDAQLTVTILEGKGTGMPAFAGRLGEAQAKTLAAHLRSLAPDAAGPKGTGAAAPGAPADDFEARFQQLVKEFDELQRQMKELTAPSADPPKGRAARAEKRMPADGPEAPPQAAGLYQQLCQRCHGPDGKGTKVTREADDPPDFSRRAWQERRTDAQMLASILEGKEAEMPAFGRRLTEAEGRALVAHIRSFASARPATPPGPPAKPADKSSPTGRERESPWNSPATGALPGASRPHARSRGEAESR